VAFAGTISLRPATLAAVLEDVIGSLHAHGFRRVLVVNGHGGNSATIATAVEQAKLATGMPLVAAVFGYALVAEQARTLLPPEAIGHAGADEAAVVLAAAPGLADASAFGPAEPTGELAQSHALLRAAGGVLARPYHEVTRNGATGDSGPATAEIGRRIIDGAGRRLAEIAETLIAEHGALSALS
jgi:creatinine amidohydrolase